MTDLVPADPVTCDCCKDGDFPFCACRCHRVEASHSRDNVAFRLPGESRPTLAEMLEDLEHEEDPRE